MDNNCIDANGSQLNHNFEQLCDKFSGNSETDLIRVNDWVNHFESLTKQLSDDNRINALTRHLTGNALKWFNDRSIEATNSWDVVHNALIKQFGRPKVCPLEEANERRLKPNETIESYYNDMRRLRWTHPTEDKTPSANSYHNSRIHYSRTQPNSDLPAEPCPRCRKHYGLREYHWKRLCPRPEPALPVPKTSSSAAEPDDSTNNVSELVFYDIFVNDIKVCSVLCSGSTVTAISSSTARRLGLTADPSTATTIRQINGTVKSLGYIQTRLRIEGRTLPFAIHVLEPLSCEAVIGIDAAKAFKLKVDFSRQTKVSHELQPIVGSGLAVPPHSQKELCETYEKVILPTGQRKGCSTPEVTAHNISQSNPIETEPQLITGFTRRHSSFDTTDENDNKIVSKGKQPIEQQMTEQLSAIEFDPIAVAVTESPTNGYALFHILGPDFSGDFSNKFFVNVFYPYSSVDIREEAKSYANKLRESGLGFTRAEFRFHDLIVRFRNAADMETFRQRLDQLFN